MNSNNSIKLCGLLLVGMIASYAVSAQENRASKVPKTVFAETLNQQLAQLKNDTLIRRFSASRKLLAKDKHRPYYHFINPEGHLNDPNGLSFWKGNWHLFYQAYPPEDPRQHWGHAVSKDLIHWKDLPYAIYPDPEKMVYSGSVFVEEDRAIAMYHGVGAGSMVAISDDPLLLNWKKHTGKAVIPEPKPGEDLPYNVYDPCIWKKGNYYYTLLSGVRPVGPGGKDVRANFLLRSEDLTNWEYLHPFVENDRYSRVGDDGACPYFWPIGDKGKYILLYFSHESGGKYLLGDYDTVKDKFIVTDGGDFNHGPVGNGGVHAPTAYPDGKGGVIVLFNMNTGKEISEGNYTEMMTLPRLLTLDDDNKLVMRPAGDIKSVRQNRMSVEETTLPANKEIVFDEISGDAMEMEFVIDMKEASSIEIDVLRSPGKEEYTRILYYKNGGYLNRDYRGYRPQYSAIALDNSRGSVSEKVRARIPEIASVLIGDDELVNIRVFIDRSIVEVFVNGRQCISVRTYPDRNDSKGVSIRAQGKDAVLKSLNAWKMKNIYKGSAQLNDL